MVGWNGTITRHSFYYKSLHIEYKNPEAGKNPTIIVRDAGLLVIVINFTTKKRRRSMNGTTPDQT